MHRRFLRIAAELLIDISRQLHGFVGPGSPIFTAPLADGLSYAHDPASDSAYTGAHPMESFGTHRCRLLSEALAWSLGNGTISKDDRLRDVETYFRSKGITLEKPHLNPGTVDQFQGSRSEWQQ
jgi:hypothetical protein